MADDEEKTLKRPKRQPRNATVIVVNKRGVEANPRRCDLDKWLAKGWSIKTPAQAE